MINANLGIKFPYYMENKANGYYKPLTENDMLRIKSEIVAHRAKVKSQKLDKLKIMASWVLDMENELGYVDYKELTERWNKLEMSYNEKIDKYNVNGEVVIKYYDLIGNMATSEDFGNLIGVGNKGELKPMHKKVDENINLGIKVTNEELGEIWKI